MTSASKPRRYVAKPREIEAIQWNGDFTSLPADWRATDLLKMRGNDLICTTLRHVAKVRIGDYIVRGTNSEFYPVDPATFEFKYEEVQ
jgi:hypothetical protein